MQKVAYIVNNMYYYNYLVMLKADKLVYFKMYDPDTLEVTNRGIEDLEDTDLATINNILENVNPGFINDDELTINRISLDGLAFLMDPKKL